MHNVFHTLHAEVSKGGLNNSVGTDGDALAVQLAETSLVDKVSHALQVGVAVSDEGLHKAQQADSGGVDANEHTVVNLSQAKKLQDLSDLRRHTVDTANTNNEE